MRKDHFQPSSVKAVAGIISLFAIRDGRDLASTRKSTTVCPGGPLSGHRWTAGSSAIIYVFDPMCQTLWMDEGDYHFSWMSALSRAREMCSKLKKFLLLFSMGEAPRPGKNLCGKITAEVPDEAVRPWLLSVHVIGSCSVDVLSVGILGKISRNLQSRVWFWTFAQYQGFFKRIYKLWIIFWITRENIKSTLLL